MTGVELEDSGLVDSVTEIASSSDISGGERYGASLRWSETEVGPYDEMLGVMYMARLIDLHQDSSHLGQNIELR